MILDLIKKNFQIIKDSIQKRFLTSNRDYIPLKNYLEKGNEYCEAINLKKNFIKNFNLY